MSRQPRAFLQALLARGWPRIAWVLPGRHDRLLKFYIALQIFGERLLASLPVTLKFLRVLYRNASHILLSQCAGMAIIDIGNKLLEKFICFRDALH
jgi:hypothetical protein